MPLRDTSREFYTWNQRALPCVYSADWPCCICLQVFLRDFGTLNQTLFDDVLSDFQPLLEDDVLVLNWGAWYQRYDWGGREVSSPSLKGKTSSCIDSHNMLNQSHRQ